MTTETEPKAFDVEVTLGYVRVFVPVYDCNNGMRSIDFPRPGNQWALTGVRCHWTANRYISQAKRIAGEVLKQMRKVK